MKRKGGVIRSIALNRRIDLVEGGGRNFSKEENSRRFHLLSYSTISNSLATKNRSKSNPFFQGRGATFEPLIDRYNSIRLFEGRKSRETWDKLKGGGSADRRWYARKQFGGPQDRGGR